MDAWKPAYLLLSPFGAQTTPSWEVVDRVADCTRPVRALGVHDPALVVVPPTEPGTYRVRREYSLATTAGRASARRRVESAIAYGLLEVVAIGLAGR
jgi:hypothetical protein